MIVISSLENNKIMLEIRIDSDIILKSIKLQNSVALYNLIVSGKKYLRKWLPWVDNTRSIKDTQNYIKSVVDKDMFDGRVVLEIWYRNELCGLIDMHNGVREIMKLEIGYWLAEEFQGKGIMVRACEGIIKYAFTEMGFNKIVIKCAEDNLKSQAIPQKLNFFEEGIERDGQFLHADYINLKVYSLLKKEWISRESNIH